jgi:hypothetical protein
MHRVYDAGYFPNYNYPSFNGKVIEGTTFFTGKNFIKKQFHIPEFPLPSERQSHRISLYLQQGYTGYIAYNRAGYILAQ